MVIILSVVQPRLGFDGFSMVCFLATYATYLVSYCFALLVFMFVLYSHG